MNNRITKNNITSLQPNEIFVFGSNLSGIHGGGAAYLAHQKFGAVYGNGIGIQGQSYAIPTKSENIAYTLKPEVINVYVQDFIKYTKQNTDKVFLVTLIGCGLAGLTPSQIAPLFKDCIDSENVHLPLEFINIINNR